MAEIKVKSTDIEKLRKAAEKFKVSISGLPEEGAVILENEINVTISGITGNVHSFIANVVDEERGIFCEKSGRELNVCKCLS